MDTNLICMLGAPGAGKGTQGRLLAEHLGGQHVSVGDLVRAQLQAGHRVPRDRKTRLVDTAHTVELIAAAVDHATTTVVLDGFPRDAAQVDAFTALPWRCSAVLWLDVDVDTAIQRMLARGRAGEDVPQIGMRHLNHAYAAGALKRQLRESGAVLHEVDARGSVVDVQKICRAVIHRSCG